jgi:hypothetical protein
MRELFEKNKAVSQEFRIFGVFEENVLNHQTN